MENKKTGFASILSDYGFKKVFADPTDTRFLRRALKALTQKDKTIKEVRFLRNEFKGVTEKSRGGVYDLICEDENGNAFLVEMQLGPYKHFIQRAKFYAFHYFGIQVKKGKYLFDDLKPIYSISFLEHSIFPSSKEYYHFARLKNQKNEELDAQLTHIIIEFRKFDKQAHELESDLDKLIYFMKNLQHIKGIELLPPTLSEEWLKIAMEKVDVSQMTPEEYFNFEVSLAQNASLLYMEREEEKRRKKLDDKAYKKLEEAQKIQEEAQKTQEEAQKTQEEAKKTQEEAQKTQEEAQKQTKQAKEVKLNIVLYLHSKGLAKEEIAEATALSIEEISRLLE